MKIKLNKFLIYILLSGFIIASVRILDLYGVFDDWFKVSALIVKGNHYTSDEIIIKTSGIKIDDSLYALNLDSSNNEIMGLPYIKGVTISRFFPNQVIINVSEHQPIAAVWKDKHWFLISREGSILPLLHDIDLGKVPILSGLKFGKEEIGKKIRSAALFWAFIFVKNLYKNNTVTYAYAGEIDFKSNNRIKIYLIKSKAKVILSRADYSANLAKLKLFIRKGKNLDFLRTGEYIDLCFKDRIIIKKA